jgi:hypothetical protein
MIGRVINMKLKKGVILLFTVLLTLNTISCSKRIDFPDKTDFELSYEISNKSPKLNDEITVYAKLKNKTNNKYILNHGPDVINIILKDINDETPITELSILKPTEIQPDSFADQTQKFKFLKKGQYKLIVMSSFYIENNGQTKTYFLKGKEQHFNVED